MILAFAPGAALAGDLETYVGGAVSAGVTAFATDGDLQVASADALTTQAEVDGAVGWGWGHARVDLDLHLDPNAFGADGAALLGDVIAYPTVTWGDVLWPEWAMVQLGRPQHVRVGLINPNLGLEDWDVWSNYATTYSNNFIYVGSGRFLGVDAGLSTDAGYDLFVFGGYDVDWVSAGGGVGVATEQDAWSTWSGIVVYPVFAGGGCPGGADTCFNAFAQLAFELYPADPLWLGLEAYPGVKGSSLYASTQVVANVLPEATVNPYVRAEVLIDPDRVTGAPGHTVGLGARTDLPEWLRVIAEAKAILPPGGPASVGGALSVAVHRPEPYAYSFTDPFGADAEE